MSVACAHTVQSLPARSPTVVASPRRQALDDFRHAFPAALAAVPLVQQAFTDVERAVARGMSTTPALAEYCDVRRGLRRLHDGGSAEIARVVSPGGVGYAVKLFKTTEPVAFFQALNEARLLARQFGIMPRFHELGVAPTGRPYLVQEWVSGGSLQAVCKTAFNWPLHWQLRCIRAVISAVAVAHSGGLIHRDICPDNIMWTEHPQQQDGRVRLVDYGVSILRRDSGPDVTEADRAAVRLLCEWGRKSHAVGIFSPHLPLDDVYALGITVYECCGGNREDINALGNYLRQGGSHPARSAVDALAQRFGNGTRVGQYRPPAALHELLRGATAFSPSLCYQDAGAMLRDFDARFPDVTDDDQPCAY